MKNGNKNENANKKILKCKEIWLGVIWFLAIFFAIFQLLLGILLGIANFWLIFKVFLKKIKG